MDTQHYPLNELKRDIPAIASKYFDTKSTKLFIFGSRATNKGDDRSDIDLGIESKNLIPQESVYKFKEELENLPTLYTFDVVDFSQVSDSFAKIASENKIYLN